MTPNPNPNSLLLPYLVLLRGAAAAIAVPVAREASLFSSLSIFLTLSSILALWVEVTRASYSGTATNWDHCRHHHPTSGDHP